MDETESEGVVATVGERLREAREAKGLSVEDIAAQTRIPTRHLLSLEAGDWAKLPAATYSIGFAKNYANALGLDRGEIGDQLRAEMGGYSAATTYTEVYETVDPARTMPKGLVFGALALLLLAVAVFTWLSNRSVSPEQQLAEPANVAAPVANEAAPAPQPQAVAQGPVVLTATDAVWIQVKDGAANLHMGELAAGQRFEVPVSAVAPVLTTGKPEALRITVGTAQAPPVGEPGRTVSGVSLKPADLLRTGQAPAPSGSVPAQTPTLNGPPEGNFTAPAPGTAGQ